MDDSVNGAAIYQSLDTALRQTITTLRETVAESREPTRLVFFPRGIDLIAIKVSAGGFEIGLTVSGVASTEPGQLADDAGNAASSPSPAVSRK